jgi:hypothetical protein
MNRLISENAYLRDENTALRHQLHSYQQHFPPPPRPQHQTSVDEGSAPESGRSRQGSGHMHPPHSGVKNEQGEAMYGVGGQPAPGGGSFAQDGYQSVSPLVHPLAGDTYGRWPTVHQHTGPVVLPPRDRLHLSIPPKSPRSRLHSSASVRLACPRQFTDCILTLSCRLPAALPIPTHPPISAIRSITLPPVNRCQRPLRIRTARCSTIRTRRFRHLARSHQVHRSRFTVKRTTRTVHGQRYVGLRETASHHAAMCLRHVTSRGLLRPTLRHQPLVTFRKLTRHSHWGS